MLSILSPAKTLDFETPVPTGHPSTRPTFLRDAAELAEILKELSPNDIGSLMGISDKLSELNHGRFQDWEAAPPKTGTKEAVFAFQGDVYRGLQADDWTPAQVAHAQDHLRILSGLYGILRPLDRILPYRLEMGTSLKNARGKDLYAFWGSKIAERLNQQLKKSESKFLLNLASNEYFHAVDTKKLNYPVISPAFKEYKNGSFKIISFYTKAARGTMAAWVIKKKVKTLKQLIKFSEDDYRYEADLSSETVPVFVRGGE